MSRRTSVLLIALAVLAVGNACIAWHILHPTPAVLKVSFLDIGQGDSILIQGPTGIQMLIDGGPDRSVLRKLSREMGVLDRTIDLVLETHPDKDHIGGLADVLAQYQVKYFLSSEIPGATDTFERVEAAWHAEPGLTHLTTRRGMRIHLGGAAYADVLYPDQDQSSQTETNTGSAVLHLVYGSTSFMLTGDLPSTKEDYLVSLDGKGGVLKSDVLKAGHHGSKYSTDAVWLAAVQPSIVVISAGRGNTYGHPNPEAIARVQAAGAKVVSTIDHGTIDFVSDGQTVLEKDQR